MTQITILLLALVAANLPWFSNRLFFLISFKTTSKNIAWCLFELIILYFVVGAIALYAELSTLGQVASQGWEFYAVTFSLFLVFSFPGFIYKTLWSEK
jgi:Na+(H+)/acetate symporter ActP